MSEITRNDVVRLDSQAKSVFLRDGTRLGFAAARRRGLDVEAMLAEAGPGPHLSLVR